MCRLFRSLTLVTGSVCEVLHSLEVTLTAITITEKPYGNPPEFTSFYAGLALTNL